jgi:hypothetical protein
MKHTKGNWLADQGSKGKKKYPDSTNMVITQKQMGQDIWVYYKTKINKRITNTKQE